MSIEQSIVSYLATIVPVTSLLGTRIYPDDIPDEETALPWVRYLVREVQPKSLITGPAEKGAHGVEFEAFCSTYSSGRAVAKALREAMDGVSFGNVEGSFFAGESHDPVESGFLVTVKFTMHATL